MALSEILFEMSAITVLCSIRNDMMHDHGTEKINFFVKELFVRSTCVSSAVAE